MLSTTSNRPGWIGIWILIFYRPSVTPNLTISLISRGIPRVRPSVNLERVINAFNFLRVLPVKPYEDLEATFLLRLLVGVLDAISRN